MFRTMVAACLFLWSPAITPCSAQSPVEVRWQQEIQPLVQEYCLDCHSGAEPDGSLDLEQFTSVSRIADQRRLWKKLASRVRDGQMPPPAAPQPDPRIRQQLLDWIENDLPSVACSHPHHAGPVTLRRLTRSEYANTIRDLLKVDYDPAGEFPTDESGYGFDNIGDVLSVSPLLLEKYLKAAEEISGLVIDDPARHRIDRTTITSEIPTVRGSRLIGSGQFLTTRGTLTAPLSITREGEYEITVEAWAQQAGDETARLGVARDGQLLQQFDVEATRSEPGEYRLQSRLHPRDKSIGLSFMNDFFNPREEDRSRRDRNLAILSLRIRGPLDGTTASEAQQHFLFRTPGDGLSPAEAARRIIRLHGSRAWRRPLTSSEIDELLGIFELGQASGETFEGSMQLVIQSLLVSPWFLFKVEAPPPRDGSPRVLGDYEKATALSYFLWGTLPDNRLFERAAAGQLNDPQVVADEVQRMLADRRSLFLVENFADQWLQLRVLEGMDPDPDLFQTYDEPLQRDMIRETRLLLNEVLRSDLPLEMLLNARHTWVNRRLARHYGLPTHGLRNDRFERVDLQDTDRGGLLTHASILTLTSNPTRTSPVKRGKWVLENLLGDPPPPALPDVPQLDSQAELTGTLRERMEQHRADPSCAACHHKMDAIGFALEEYDAVGRFRKTDDGQPIDPTGRFPGGSGFSGPRQLQTVILQQNRPAFVRCFVEKLFTFALGRGPLDSDDCVIDLIATRAVTEAWPVSRIVQAIVASEPFRTRSHAYAAERDRPPEKNGPRDPENQP